MGMLAGFRMGLTLAVITALSGALRAEPSNGFGVTLGGVVARQGGNSSGGASLGGDAQFVLNPQWSINPYLMVSYERSKALKQNLSDNLGGIQARYWFDRIYVGPQVFFHDRLLYQGGRVSSSTYGPGIGAVLGWEGPSGCSVGAQLDALESQFGTGVAQRNALRVYLGYRWK
jgi:hypothetical protein